MEEQTEVADIQARVLQNTLAEVASSRNDRSKTDDSNEGKEDSTVVEAAAIERCCVICLDSVSELCEANPCKHRDYDYLCLLNWLQQQPKCPLCKSDVREVRYDFQHSDGNCDDVSNGYKVYIVPAAKESPTKQQHQSSGQPQRNGGGGLVRPLDRGHAFRRRRRFEERPTPRPATEDEVLVRRRRVYQQQLYSLHVGTSPRTGYRDLTPATFESDPELVSRARRWLRRELQVFEFLHATPTPTSTSASASGSSSTTTTTTTTPSTGITAGAAAAAPAQGRSTDRLARRRANNAEFLLEYVVAILKTVDIQGSQGQAEEMLKDFLGRDNTRLLLHELKSFLRSPYSLDVWDRKVQYPNPKRRRPHDDGGVGDEEDEGGDSELRRSSSRRSIGHGGSSARRRRLEDNSNSDEQAGTPLQRGMLDSYRPSYSSQYDRRRRGPGHQYTPD
ncbi:hypothetical protein SLS62_003651 [Diatrype stigma]|uniref:RING-type E3 ubiquitin transferase n=1 Tax=Diatrype stigma TaxID=117547 RepID=A0AAN9V6D9_9PEZI